LPRHHLSHTSVITLDVTVLSNLLQRPITDHLHFFHSFIETVEALREQGVQHDVILLIHGPTQLQQPERVILDRLRVYCYPINDLGKGVIAVPPHEVFDSHVAQFLRAKISILRLTQYTRLLYFDPTTRLGHGCDAMLESMHGNFSVHRGEMLDGPFDTRAFLIIPSKQTFYDVDDAWTTVSFSIEQGWLETGSIPTWGPPANQKHDWSFARSSQDIGLLYYYFYMSPVHREGRVHASTIDPEAWAKCVPLHREM
jgi:hypothetical protein